jgi:hypothetical protein
MSDDFFIGYLPTPAALARRLRRVTAVLIGIAALAALCAGFLQSGYANSYFDFGKTTTMEGMILEKPYPVLLVQRAAPGSVGAPAGAEGGASPFSVYPLVDQLKQGADEHVRGLNGKTVRVQGSLIYRGPYTMLELKPGPPVVIAAAAAGEVPALKSLGAVTLTGEIVDSKCYLGVMNPGAGKVHRDCATRCISGGVPAALVVSDAEQRGELYLLRGAHEDRLPPEVAAHIGERITLRGQAVVIGEMRFLLI